MMNSHMWLTKNHVNLYTCLLSKLQRNVEITAMFCMHVRRDRTDQSDNKDMLKDLLKEMNNVELFQTVLDVAIVCIYHLKTFDCS